MSFVVNNVEQKHGNIKTPEGFAAVFSCTKTWAGSTGTQSGNCGLSQRQDTGIFGNI
jgi:hypothetical protein